MRDFVDVDAAVVGFLLVIAIPALQTGERVGGVSQTDQISNKTGREGREGDPKEEMDNMGERVC